MGDRHLPIRPDLKQLAREAEELQRGLRGGEETALAAWSERHPDGRGPEEAEVADAQLILARRYGFGSWTRVELACRLVDAIWGDEVDAVRELLQEHPELRDERALGQDSNWGPPMSHAANLGRERIVDALYELGATDVQWAFGRACLHGRIRLARRIFEMGARPQPDSVMAPAETQNGPGMEFLLDLGAELGDKHGRRLAPVALVLETYCRDPHGKHQCLELFVDHGIALPDTPPMAVHRGRVDLLEAHMARDPDVLSRNWSHEEIYPPELGCHDDHTLALHGTPLAGAGLLHLCVDNDEIEIARWLLERGADPNQRADVDADGFGGHTPIFGCVVSQTWEVGLRRDAEFARLLLEAGADPNVSASLRKQLRFVADEALHEYHGVTPADWGRRFHDRAWVNTVVLDLLTGGDEDG